MKEKLLRDKREKKKKKEKESWICENILLVRTLLYNIK